jgi:hypothetical protein
MSQSRQYCFSFSYALDRFYGLSCLILATIGAHPASCRADQGFAQSRNSPMSLKESALQENVYRAEDRLNKFHAVFARAMGAYACDAELEYHSQNIEISESELDQAYEDLYTMPYIKAGRHNGECQYRLLSDD